MDLTARASVGCVSEARELRAVIGERVRAVREGSNLRQQDVSDAAKSLGLPTWTPTRIAALERGDKAISAEDLLRLVAVLTAATGRAVDVAELFDSPELIALSDVACIPARGVAAVLRGADSDEHLERVKVNQNVPGLDTPERRRASERRHAIARAAGRNLFELLGVGDLREIDARYGEADERAARHLGETIDTFPIVCNALWGRSLSAERDSRLAAAGGNQGSAATVAARRGRITRELLAEARELLARADQMDA